MKKTSTITIIVVIALAVFIFIAVKILLNVQYDNNLDKQTPYFQNSSLLALVVVDGDTFEMADGEVVRLLCVDTPEFDSEGYEEATDYLSSIVYGENITIERHGLDMYNRTLAWVYYGDILINKEIVDNGYGTLFEYNGTDCGRMK